MATAKYEFTPEAGARMIELGKEGASQKMMFSELGIGKSVVERLKKEDPAFVEALELAITHAQAFWEQKILDNIDSKTFNSRLAEIALRGQFQDDYRERVEPKSAKVDVTIDFGAAVKELIAELKGAGK